MSKFLIARTAFPLALLFASSLLSLASANAATITLTGTVRDFLQGRSGPPASGHPDFELPPIANDLGIVQSNLGGDKKPVYASANTTTTTTGAANFNQWFNNVAGVNQSTQYSIDLTGPDGFGNFVYEDNTFFPIDNQLFGNEGNGQNYHFTFELHTTFTYNSTAQKFTFQGDDDVWVFINGKLAIDLGGIHPVASQTITLDSIFAANFGLALNNNYSLDFFFAERKATGSNFRIETSLELRQPEVPNNEIPLPASSLIWAVLSLGAAVGRKRWMPLAFRG